MDAITSIAAYILKISTGGLHEVIICRLTVSQPACYCSLDRWTKRGAKRRIGAWRIIVVVRLHLSAVEILPHQIGQHEHIWLLEHLGIVAAFDPKIDLGRNLARF